MPLMQICVFSIHTGYPSLRIEKNDLRSVTLIEAKAKVKDIAISRERVTLRDVLHEGTSRSLFSLSVMSTKEACELCSLEKRQKAVKVIFRFSLQNGTQFQSVLLALQKRC